MEEASWNVTSKFLEKRYSNSWFRRYLVLPNTGLVSEIHVFGLTSAPKESAFYSPWWGMEYGAVSAVVLYILCLCLPQHHDMVKYNLMGG